MSKRVREYEVDPSPQSLVLKSHAFYEALASSLDSGSRVFINNMNRKDAYYAKRRFTELVGAEIMSMPAESKGQSGYLFYRKEAPK